MLTFFSDTGMDYGSGDNLMFGIMIKDRTALFVFAFLIGVTFAAVDARAQGSCPTPDVVLCSAPRAVLGPKTWEEWKAEAGWDNYSAGNYHPPQWKLNQLADLVRTRNVTFLVFGGSWCSDSKAQLPVLFSLFDLASIPAARQQLYGVDINVKEPTRTADRYKISRVPSVIVLSNGKEIGRIAEFPRPNWEDDLIRVLSG